MANFNIKSVSEMISAADKIAQDAEDFLKIAGEVFNAANELHDDWEGDSYDKFLETQETAHGFYEEMTNILHTYVDAIKNMAKKYQEADDQAKAAIKAK